MLEEADGVATRAIAIEAPASAVWPWLVQMGPSPRGGAYTYDWIENLLGLKMHSAGRVLPELQAPGDRRRHQLRNQPHAGGADRPRACVRMAKRRRQLGLELSSCERDMASPGSSAETASVCPRCSRVGMLLMEPASLVMEHKMLLGIKERAERLAAAGIDHEQTCRQPELR